MEALRRGDLKEGGVMAGAEPKLHEVVCLDACVRCTLCADSCPTYVVSGDPRVAPAFRLASLKALMKGSRLTEEACREAFKCTVCGHCMVVCPFSIKTVDLWLLLRHYACLLGKRPAELGGVESSLLTYHNPYGADASLRTYWAEIAGIDTSKLTSSHGRVLLFMGCTSAYRSVGQDVLVSAAAILDKAKEDWTTLGEEEWCCGYPLLLLGNWEAAKEFAEHNVKAIEAKGVKLVATTCATCYKMLKLEYPALLGRPLKFRVVHMVELIAKYFTELRLGPVERLDLTVAYHDPCDLARIGCVVEPPRFLLREVAKLVELPGNRERSSCCGGGGLLQVVDPDLRLKIAQRRVEEALSVGANVLASACPACKSSFVEAAREMDTELEVLDVTELVARALGLA